MSWPEMPDFLTIRRRILDSGGNSERIRSRPTEVGAQVQSSATEAARNAELAEEAQSRNAAFAEAEQRLTVEIVGYKEDLTRLGQEHNALREEIGRLAALADTQQHLTAEVAEYKRNLSSTQAGARCRLRGE